MVSPYLPKVDSYWLLRGSQPPRKVPGGSRMMQPDPIRYVMKQA